MGFGPALWGFMGFYPAARCLVGSPEPGRVRYGGYIVILSFPAVSQVPFPLLYLLWTLCRIKRNLHRGHDLV